MALAGRDAEEPGGYRPGDDGHHGGAKRHQRVMGISAEVHHVVDGFRDFGVEGRHHHHPEEITEGRHQDGFARVHCPGGDAGGDRVGRVRPAVDENHAQRQQNRDRKGQIRRELRQEIRKGYCHNCSL